MKKHNNNKVFDMRGWDLISKALPKHMSLV